MMLCGPHSEGKQHKLIDNMEYFKVLYSTVRIHCAALVGLFLCCYVVVYHLLMVTVLFFVSMLARM